MFRQARNKVTRLLRNAKRNYFHNAITKNKGDSKAIWHLLRNVQSNNTNTKSQHSPNLVMVQGKKFESAEEIANAFNDFFTSVSAQYVTPNDVHHDLDLTILQQYVSKNVPNGKFFDIPEISQHFVLKFLKSLDSTKATGLDDISARLLKSSADVISASITNIINLA